MHSAGASGAGVAIQFAMPEIQPQTAIRRPSFVRFATHGGGRYFRARNPLDPAAPVLGRLGTLETRLARTKSEIREAQGLRYDVFFREMSAAPSPITRLLGRDKDGWDAVCDHLLVIERAGGGERIVGTYRFLRAEIARLARRPFYTQSEFDVAPLMARHPALNFMELGRSCVLPEWRTRRTIELLWHGTWAYVLANRIDVMIGCASFHGTDPSVLAEPLSFLFHHASPGEGWNVAARGREKVAMDLLPAEAINAKRALHALPPLIKGYLRLGAQFGRQAVIDRRFGTTDVLVILPVANINSRYLDYYGADAGRHAKSA